MWNVVNNPRFRSLIFDNRAECGKNSKIPQLSQIIFIFLQNGKARFIEETNTRKAVHITMVTTYGVRHNEYFNDIQSQVTLDDLFAEVLLLYFSGICQTRHLKRH